MQLNFAETIVVLCYRLAWFLGQAVLAYALWNFFVASVFDGPALGLVDAITTYALILLLIRPPKLSIEVR